MAIEQRKSLLWVSLIITLLVSIVIVSMRVSAEGTVLAVDPPTIVDFTLIPDSTFHIDVTVSDVSDLWGYQFVLSYDTNILTATSYTSYDPFTNEAFSTINDTGGFVSMVWGMEFGVPEGFTGTASVARIDFKVDDLGVSALDLHDTKLVLANPPTDDPKIAHDLADGYFQNMKVHDIAITDLTAPSTVLVNQTAAVTVTAKNEGNFDETFNVSVSYDTTLIETQLDVTLSAGTDTTLTFTWDTTGVAEGTYTITANASVVSGETDTDDNVFVGGEVTIILTAVHDIAITSVTSSPSEPVIGDSVSISVTVANEGNMDEIFDVSVSYDSTLIGTQTGVSLVVGATKTLTFTWDTTGVDLGTYTIKAEASVFSGETDTDDNTGTKIVTVKEATGTSDFLLYTVAGIVIVIVAATVLVYFLRVRKPTPA